jgi:hypothetical protein
MSPDLEARLVEALKFYASKDTYRSTSTGFALQYDPSPEPIQVDEGAKARAALAAYTTENPPTETPA